MYLDQHFVCYVLLGLYGLCMSRCVVGMPSPMLLGWRTNLGVHELITIGGDL